MIIIGKVYDQAVISASQLNHITLKAGVIPLPGKLLAESDSLVEIMKNVV